MNALAETEIHLWQVNQADFGGEELVHDCLEWLTAEELRRYDRYHFDQHRKEFLLGRMLMRRGLSHYCDVEPADWVFQLNEFGKPSVSRSQSGQSLFFNLSHSGGELVLALARLEHLGVDIEATARSRRAIKIADRYFSPAEHAALLALPESEQLDRFYDLWTLKEAYIKARGMGLALPLSQFSYDLQQEGSIGIRFGPEIADDPSSWQFWKLDGGDGFKLALAVRSGGKNVVNSLRSYRLRAEGGREETSVSMPASS